MTTDNHEAERRLEDALLSITALSQDSIKIHEMVFLGTRLFGRMCFDCAPNEELAWDTLNAALDTAYQDHNSEKTSE